MNENGASPRTALVTGGGRGIGRSIAEGLANDGLAVIIVDREDRIRAFLPQLDDLVTEGLVIIDPVEVIRYVGRPRDSAG